MQLETYRDKLYIFYIENFRGYRYSGKTYLEIYEVQCLGENKVDNSFLNSYGQVSKANLNFSLDSMCLVTLEFHTTDGGVGQDQAGTTDKLFHLTPEGIAVVREHKQFRIINIEQHTWKNKKTAELDEGIPYHTIVKTDGLF